MLRRAGLVVLALFAAGAVGRGCFLPNTLVMLPDGEEKEIQQLRTGDEVLSWDPDTDTTVTAKVVVVHHVRTTKLIDIDLSSGRTVQVTPDHPMMSLRTGTVVSLLPETTKSDYQIEYVNMMVPANELFMDFTGSAVAGTLKKHALKPEAPQPLIRTSDDDPEEALQPTQIESPYIREVEETLVMTLELEGQHWFYAHGVLVHNKGGGFSGGGFSGGSHYYYSSGNNRPVTRADYWIFGSISGAMCFCYMCAKICGGSKVNSVNSKSNECLKNNHVTVHCTPDQLAPTDPNYLQGWYCDHCNSFHARTEPLQRCPECQIDFCANCKPPATFVHNPYAPDSGTNAILPASPLYPASAPLTEGAPSTVNPAYTYGAGAPTYVYGAGAPTTVNPTYTYGAGAPAPVPEYAHAPPAFAYGAPSVPNSTYSYGAPSNPQ